MGTTVVAVQNQVTSMAPATLSGISGLRLLDGIYNVHRDFGGTPDGTTANDTPIANAMAALPSGTTNAQGGFVYLSPGVWGISATVTLTKQGITFGGMGLGGTTLHGITTLFALPGFTGPMVVVQIGAGDKGFHLQHLRLDGNNEAGVTNALELHANTAARGYVTDVQTANTPTGLYTNDNCQSIVFTNCYFNSGHTTGLNLTTNNRGLKFLNCVAGGSSYGALIGPDDAVSGNVCSNIVFQGGELYAQGSSPTAACIVRNTDSCAFFGTWMEQAGSGTITSILQIGTATATAARPFVVGRWQGNSKATYGIDVVQANRPWIQGYGTGFLSGDVKLTYATSRATIFGLTPNTTTGAALVLGVADGLLRFQGYGGGIRSVTSSGNALISDRTIIADATSGAVTVTLVAVSSCAGQILTLKRVNTGSNTVTLKGNGSDTIDGSNTVVLGSQYAEVTVQSDGTVWWKIGA